jgi:hypothetical protein
MGRDAYKRAARRRDLEEIIRKTEDDIADIEANRSGTALLEEARAMVPALRGNTARLRLMPRKTLADLEAAHRVARYIEKAAAWARIAARDYPSWNFLMNTASYCGMATEAEYGAAVQKHAAGKGGRKAQTINRKTKDDFLRWYAANRDSFPTKDAAAEAGVNRFGLSFDTLRGALTNL